MKVFLKSSLAALLLTSACAQAQVYECIDANGKKSFAKECPADTVKARELHPDIVDPGTPVTSKDKINGLEANYAAQRQAEKARAAEQDRQAADARTMAQACSSARARLEALQSGKQAKRVDPVTGEHVPMDEDARQAQIAGLQQEVADNCK